MVLNPPPPRRRFGPSRLIRGVSKSTPGIPERRLAHCCRSGCLKSSTLPCFAEKRQCLPTFSIGTGKGWSSFPISRTAFLLLTLIIRFFSLYLQYFGGRRDSFGLVEASTSWPRTPSARSGDLAREAATGPAGSSAAAAASLDRGQPELGPFRQDFPADPRASNRCPWLRKWLLSAK